MTRRPWRCEHATRRRRSRWNAQRSTQGPSHDETPDRHRQRLRRAVRRRWGCWSSAACDAGAVAGRRRSAGATFALAIVVLIVGRADAGRPVHAAAQRGGDPAALRRLPRHEPRAGPARDQSVLHAQEDLAARAQPERRRLKVNDKRGNPIEIAAVVVWHVDDTAKAAFDVDDYENFVKVQSEAAVRHLASSFAYDAEEQAGRRAASRRCSRAPTSSPARSSKELQARLEQAGVVVEEARLTHLAYAPEIAQVMLRRQQAEAIIAARQKIVHGAVSMVEMALHELSAKQVVESRRRAQGVDGVQPDDRAVRRVRSAAGHQHRHALHLTRTATARGRHAHLRPPAVRPAAGRRRRSLVGVTTDHAARRVASHFGAGGARQRLDDPRRLPAVHARVRASAAAARRAQR